MKDFLRLWRKWQSSQSPNQLCASPKLVPLCVICKAHVPWTLPLYSSSFNPLTHCPPSYTQTCTSRKALQAAILLPWSPNAPKAPVPTAENSHCVMRDKEKGRLKNGLWILPPKGHHAQQRESVWTDGRGRSRWSGGNPWFLSPRMIPLTRISPCALYYQAHITKGLCSTPKSSEIAASFYHLSDLRSMS